MPEEDTEAEIWGAMREESRQRKASNLERSTELLKQRGIEFKALSSYHYRVGEYDFWASTGMFMHRATKKKGRGVFNLIKLCEEKQAN